MSYRRPWHEIVNEIYDSGIRTRNGSPVTIPQITYHLFGDVEPESLIMAATAASDTLIASASDEANSRKLKREIVDARNFVLTCAYFARADANDERDEAYTPYKKEWMASISRAKIKYASESSEGCPHIPNPWWRRRYFLASALMIIMGVPAKIADRLYAQRIFKLEQGREG